MYAQKKFILEQVVLVLCLVPAFSALLFLSFLALLILLFPFCVQMLHDTKKAE